MDGAGAEGSWSGSLIDACGYEGSLELDLRVQEGRVSGRFRAVIADRDEPFVCVGELSGTDAGGLELQSALGAEGEEVRLTLHARVFGLSDGGAGICGNYDVAAQTFSPFRTGVVALLCDKSIPVVEAQAPTGGGG